MFVFGVTLVRIFAAFSRIRMRENAGKIRTRITPNTDTFYAVLVIDYFDINSFRNEFGQLQQLFEGNIDILVPTKNKTDSCFPDSQFKIEGFLSSYRFHRNKFVVAIPQSLNFPYL